MFTCIHLSVFLTFNNSKINVSIFLFLPSTPCGTGEPISQEHNSPAAAAAARCLPLPQHMMTTSGSQSVSQSAHSGDVQTASWPCYTPSIHSTSITPEHTAPYCYSPGKLAFYLKQIVKLLFSSQIISMGCLEQHTKSPKKSQLRNILKKLL